MNIIETDEQDFEKSWIFRTFNHNIFWVICVTLEDTGYWSGYTVK